MSNMKGKTFTTEEVRGILAWNKTMWREPINQKLDFMHCHICIENGILKESSQIGGCWHVNKSFKLPYTKVGERVFVKETWKCVELEVPVNRELKSNDILPQKKISSAIIRYLGTGDQRKITKLTSTQSMQAYKSVSKNGASPSVHMPQWASRLTLEVTDVRIERLQKITYDDAIAEGYETGGRCNSSSPILVREWFEKYWQSKHGKCSWNTNPWVVVRTFKVVENAV